MSEPAEQPELSRARWLFYAVGAAMAGWGVFGLLTGPHSNPVAWLRFAATVVIVNDGVLAPLVILGGVLLGRVLAPRRRGLFQIGLLITGSVTVVALPAVLGFGRTRDNPSSLPLNYGRGLLIVIIGVWLVLGLFAVVGRRRRVLRAAGRQLSSARRRSR